jgi:hypothetical protein
VRGGATGFLWMAVVILALGWALQRTGTVNLGLILNLWLPVLLVLAVLGAVFNMFVVPFLGRTRTSTSTANATGPTVVAAVPGAVSPMGAPVSGVAQQAVVQQTRDHTSL